MTLWFLSLLACVQSFEPERLGDGLLVTPEIVQLQAYVGVSASGSFRIRNPTSEPIFVRVSAPTLEEPCEAGSWYLAPLREELGSGELLSVSLSFVPVKVQRCNAEVVISEGEFDADDGPNVPSPNRFTVQLRGEGIGTDDDGDGFADDAPFGFEAQRDCDDSDPEVFPGAPELCDDDEIDHDCDGERDEGETPVEDPLLGQTQWFPDRDDDGYVDLFGSSVWACRAPLGWAAATANDCNDRDADIHPGVLDRVGDPDRNCDGRITCHADHDRDGYGGDDTRSWPATDPDCERSDTDLDTGSPSPVADDCDDTNPAVNLGAEERCTPAGVDDNCNRVLDDAERQRFGTPILGEALYYLDGDGDGWGDPLDVRARCVPEPGWRPVDGDCDDDDPDVHPRDSGDTGFPDPPADEIDRDCDGWERCYVDDDRDGWGTRLLARTSDLTCTLLGYSSLPTDCDDDRPTVHPTAPEQTANGRDDDCDGLEACYVDRDDDGHGVDALRDTGDLACASPGVAGYPDDCHDSDPAISPSAPERCNDQDDDCDERVDDDDLNDVLDTDLRTWRLDNDNDGYGEDNPRGAIRRCGTPDLPVGYVPDDPSLDCDDRDAAVHPDTDTDPTSDPPADGLDQDCDGLEACFSDDDTDGWGTPALRAVPDLRCLLPGVSPTSTDCDDTVATVNPGLTELCDAADVDEDCNGRADDREVGFVPFNATFWLIDADRDDYAGGGNPLLRCDEPNTGLRYIDALLSLGPDCDDTRPTINPGAQEVCTSPPVDEDCDGLFEERDPSVAQSGLAAWYLDRDRDLAGSDTDPPVEACFNPDSSRYAATAGDCDDRDADRYPGADELPASGKDEDCDQLESCYCDLDGDGLGAPFTAALTPDLTCASRPTPAVPATTCDPSTVARNDLDCLDDDATVGSTRTWYLDVDGDRHGTPLNVSLQCDPPTGAWVASGDDCDDTTPAISPDQPERCDPADQDEDCDGLADNRDLTNSPAGTVAYFADLDRDGYGDPLTSRDACDDEPGWSRDPDDCDDADARRNPSEQEAVASGVDEDCDGAELCYCDRDGDGLGERATLLSADPTCTPLPFPLAAAEAACTDLSTPVTDNADDCDPGDASASNTSTVWYRDHDEDGVAGSSAAFVIACQPPAPIGWATVEGDCDDYDEEITPARPSVGVPGAPDVCDGVDNDCDGEIDESPTDACYLDLDGDGAGDPTEPVPSCPGACPSGTAALGDDCDDTRDDVAPGAPERCDGLDNGCEAGALPPTASQIDDGGVCVGWTYVIEGGDLFLYQPALTTWDNAVVSCEGIGYRLLTLEAGEATTLITDLCTGANITGQCRPLLGYSWNHQPACATDAWQEVGCGAPVNPVLLPTPATASVLVWRNMGTDGLFAVSPSTTRPYFCRLSL